MGVCRVNGGNQFLVRILIQLDHDLFGIGLGSATITEVKVRFAISIDLI